MVLSIILAVILFGVLVTVHELGHFIAAKKCGVGINEFSIGMGPAVFTKVGRDGVKYSVRLLPDRPLRFNGRRGRERKRHSKFRQGSLE